MKNHSKKHPVKYSGWTLSYLIYIYYIVFITYILYYIYYTYYTIFITYIIYKVNKIFQHISKNLKILKFYVIIYIEVEGFPFSFNFIKDKVASFLLSKNTVARCTDSYAAEARFKSFRLDWFRTFEPGFGFFVCQCWKVPKEKRKTEKALRKYIFAFLCSL